MSETNSVSPLRQRMIEDMAARKLNPHTQRSHISSCKRFRRLAQTLTRYSDARQGAPLPIAPRRGRRQHLQPENQIPIALAAHPAPKLLAASCLGAFWTPAAGAR